MPTRHPLNCGGYDEAAKALEPDVVLCVGVRHHGLGQAKDYTGFAGRPRILALGHDSGNLKNIPGLQTAVLADESRAHRADAGGRGGAQAGRSQSGASGLLSRPGY